LPACVAAAVMLIVLPISWVLRHDHAGTLWVLAWTIAMPMLLAVPIGKGFSKPDFWSRDLSLPSFVAVRPFATGDVLVTKLKVAAVSASAAWLVVLFFLVFWLPLWADLSDLTMIRVGFWMVYHSIAPQYAIAALGLLAGLLLTWKFLVGGLWVGLSGSSRLFLGSGAAYCASGILAMVGLGILSNYADTHKHEPPDWNRWLAVLQWIAASAVILKFLLAAFSWRSISRQKTRWYLLGWIFSCLALVVFGILLWADGMLASLLDECPMDATRLQCFLLLLSLLLIPLGRIGLGPQSLAKNRHGAEKQSKYGVSRRRPSPMNKEVSLLGALVSILALFLAAGGRDFQRVDAGGHPVRILKIGSSGPTVVFEAGAGSSLETWVRVQRQVGKFANAISYDRAGNGASPRGPTPRDGRQVASELHAMLHNADAAPPYILVGHSLGGPYVRVFAGMYPDEVAGIVLVDPTQEKLIDWAKEREPKPAAGEPRPWDEVDCAPLTFKQAQESHIAPGVPVVLLSGTGPREVPGFAPPELKREVLQDQRELYPAKLKFHREWVEKLPRGRLVATENSGHGIPWEEPELIVETVRQVVKEARLNPGPVLSRGR
jgi:pimeloyl-ACP methyl ester carboxylesterase